MSPAARIRASLLVEDQRLLGSGCASLAGIPGEATHRFLRVRDQEESYKVLIGAFDCLSKTLSMSSAADIAAAAAQAAVAALLDAYKVYETKLL